ncbi:DnaJ domain-containing protein [Bradyrhizobium sp.]|uniref:DnaJ domain-containing protein n=1 Tax=Bradyrhizobium sp. TaxID=376 RepID=UPI001DCB24CD|nr:DnaJ domain-containing protein [Bradyrhizobium sp.]MBI5321006.1 DnaJ domain-containing protein [Bradyrhizobium sp.]
MGTLYDLLGALPNDDAEGLRVAFRRAAKATHPDTNPDNPDAALRFRQLIRAHNILSDAEQRATYDQLLAIATRPPAPPPAPPARVAVYEKIHRGATNTMAATFIAAVLIGGYTVFSHVSKTSAMTEGAARTAENPPVDVASAPPPPASIREMAADKRDSGAGAGEPTTTGAIASAANAINPPLALIALPALASSPVLPPADARTLRDRGIYAYRGGDLGGALAHFNLAIAQDPGFAAAYIDRGIVFYRMRNFERAFADMSQAKRLARTDKEKAAAAIPKKPPASIRIGQRQPPGWRMTAVFTP